MAEDIHIKRKLVLVGDSSVGKTSLIRKFVLDVFSDDYITTIGTKITRKTLQYTTLDNDSSVELSLMIWDIMGQSSLDLNPLSAFYGTKGAIIVCDLTRKETMNKLSSLSAELLKTTPNIPLIFVGNKHDLLDQIQVSDSSLKELSNQFHSDYFLTSAKTGENVEQVFYNVGKLLLNKLGILVG